MTTSTHPVAPEEIMAWLDGELEAEKSHAVPEHIAGCAECRGTSELFQETSRLLAKWTVPSSPERIDSAVHEALAEHRNESRPVKTAQLSFLNWRIWTIGGAGIAVGAVLLAMFQQFGVQYEHKPMPLAASQLASDGGFGVVRQHIEGIAEKNAPSIATKRMAPAQMRNGLISTLRYDQQTSGSQATMIARTASLSIQVTDLVAARSALETILAKYGGYSATLTFDTPEIGELHLRASLRVPAGDLTAALGDFKTLGRTLNESQSGEEVTQQHADLVARLQNSRETEERLRAILQQRTGRIEDVLQVEEEIARVRGEIESMEAEQKALEHRVAFAGVDIQFVEEYKEHFGSSPISTSGQLQNAFITGMRKASATLIGLILFLEEDAPTILIWGALLGVPVYFVWRRYRRLRAMF